MILPRKLLQRKVDSYMDKNEDSIGLCDGCDKSVNDKKYVGHKIMFCPECEAMLDPDAQRDAENSVQYE